MSAIRVRVIAPLMFNREPRVRGGILSVSPLDASQLIASGRAVLCDPSDIKLLLDAEQEHTATACRDNQTFRPRGWATR